MESNQHIITKIEKIHRQPRYDIYIDGQQAFSVHEDILIKYRLAKGQQWQANEWKAILREEEHHQAFVKCLKWLARRPRTEKEISLKLREQGYESECVHDCITTLKKQGYLDDREFAKRWAEERLRLHKKGKKMIEHELRQKGIQESVIAQTLSETDDDIEWQGVLALARKKWSTQQIKESEDEKRFQQKRKTIAYLMRRGYSFELANKAVDALIDESDI